MAKRSKHPRLPSGWGSIRLISKNRTRPYAVHKPGYRNDKGDYVRGPILCYAQSWMVGFACLSAYHAGTYTPGYENLVDPPETEKGMNEFCRRLLRDYSLAIGKPDQSMTFGEVEAQWYEWKFGDNAAKKLSENTRLTANVLLKHLEPIYNEPINSLTVDKLQAHINAEAKSFKSISQVVTTLKEIYNYAIPRNLCERNDAEYVVSPTRQEARHADPFSDEELAIMWQHAHNPYIAFILIMCYSGFRVTAYKTMEINRQELYFKGGIKTAAGKGRIVPIHSALVPLLEQLKWKFPDYPNNFTYRMTSTLKKIGITGKTPHSTRHTFSRLCEKYGVRENDRKRLLGHSVGDITNDVYGHRTLEELRTEIEKIEITADCGQFVVS